MFGVCVFEACTKACPQTRRDRDREDYKTFEDYTKMGLNMKHIFEIICIYNKLESVNNKI